MQRGITLMLINHTPLYDEVWDRVDRQLHFKPDSRVREHSFTGVLPFEIGGEFSVYGIEKMNDAQIDAMEDALRNIFIEMTKENERIYALDWHHSAFLYDPRNAREQEDVWVADERYHGGGYTAHFPSFYPDGDYCFFIDENFCFGCLGHPWRQELWIFGELLRNKLERIYPGLGWIKLK